MVQQLFKDKVAALGVYFNSSKFSDLVLVAPDGRKIKAHMLVLSAGSRRLCKVCESGVLDHEKELPIWGVDSEALEIVIQTFYTGECMLTPSNVISIRDTSQRLEVRGLAAFCDRFIRDALEPDCCCTLLAQAIKFNAHDVVLHLLEYWGQKLDAVVASDDFMRAPFAVLAKALPLLSADADCDQAVLTRAVWSWLVAEPERSAHLDELVQWIKLPDGVRPADLLKHSVTLQHGIKWPAGVPVPQPAKAASSAGQQEAALGSLQPAAASPPAVQPEPGMAVIKAEASPAPAPMQGVQEEAVLQNLLPQGIPIPVASHSLLQQLGLSIHPSSVMAADGSGRMVHADGPMQGNGPIIVPLANGNTGVFNGTLQATDPISFTAAGGFSAEVLQQLGLAQGAGMGGMGMGPPMALPLPSHLLPGMGPPSGSEGRRGMRNSSPGELSTPLGDEDGMGSPVSTPAPKSSRKSGSGRSRTSNSGRSSLPRGLCQVEGCGQDLTLLRDYHQRYKICEYHLKLNHVMKEGVPQRFCQQCGRFQVLSEFEGSKRSCRTRLQRHNDRRRRRQEDDTVPQGPGGYTVDGPGGALGGKRIREMGGPDMMDPAALAAMGVTMPMIMTYGLGEQGTVSPSPLAAALEMQGGLGPGMHMGLHMLADLANLPDTNGTPTPGDAPGSHGGAVGTGGDGRAGMDRQEAAELAVS